MPWLGLNNRFMHWSGLGLFDRIFAAWQVKRLLICIAASGHGRCDADR
jgi:hypothetical protein